MPFHSTKTEQEAKELIVLHCILGLIGGKQEYCVRPTWEEGDIMSAMRTAAVAFGLEPYMDRFVSP